MTDEEIARELRAMKEGGIGGVEIQPVYPVALDDAANGVQTVPFLSQPFLDRLRLPRPAARSLGLRVDLTLGSGWPYGGPSVENRRCGGQAARRARQRAGGQVDAWRLPDIGAGETGLRAIWCSRELPTQCRERGCHDDHGGRPRVTPSDGQERELLAFIASRTGMMVKRASRRRRRVRPQSLRSRRARPISRRRRSSDADAFPAGSPPYAIFCDSLEVYGGDWTPRLLEEFERATRLRSAAVPAGARRRRHSRADAIRHDWGQTLTELVGDEFLAPLRAWAAAHGTKLRAQVYGIPPASVSSNAWRRSARRAKARSGASCAPRGGRRLPATSPARRSRRLRPGRGCIRRHSWRRRSTSKQKPIAIFSRESIS